MPSVFISYRRDDSAGYAGRIADSLQRRLGRERVFIDVEKIQTGEDFVGAIERAVGNYDVLVAVIGPRWLNAEDASGRRRLDDPQDFVRLEIAGGIRRGMRMVPVLVAGAKVPDAHNLPEDLRPLVRHQALEMSDETWANDIARLARALDPGAGRRRWTRVGLIAGACAALLAGAAITRTHRRERITTTSVPAEHRRLHGKVVDVSRRPVPDVRVVVGSKEVTTDAGGAFVADAVGMPYDVSLLATTRTDGVSKWEYWEYRGLTRTDPNLQIFAGLPERGGEVKVHVNGTQQAHPEQHEAVALAFASADKNWQRHLSVPDTQFTVYWRGPTAMQGTAHALRWTTEDDSFESSAVGFVAVDQHPMVLGDGETSTATFDVRPQAIASGLVSARVSNPRLEGQVRGLAFVQFSDGTAIPTAHAWLTTDVFRCLAPRLPDTTVALAVFSGSSNGPLAAAPFLVAHRGGLVPDAPEITLTLPKPPTAMAPPDLATGVGAKTEFSWSGNSQVFVLTIATEEFYRSINIVTSETHVRMPSLARFGVGLGAKQPCSWTVDVHGNRRTVDDAAGPTGFLDPFSADGEPANPGLEPGTYARSERRKFTSAESDDVAR